MSMVPACDPNVLLLVPYARDTRYYIQTTRHIASPPTTLLLCSSLKCLVSYLRSASSSSSVCPLCVCIQLLHISRLLLVVWLHRSGGGGTAARYCL
jgi:hypothetical protein